VNWLKTTNLIGMGRFAPRSDSISSGGAICDHPGIGAGLNVIAVTYCGPFLVTTRFFILATMALAQFAIIMQEAAKST
jgi:hypothetical protein